MLTTSRTNWGDLEPNRRLEWLTQKEGRRQTSGWDSQLAIPNTGILYQEINGVWVGCFRKAPGNDSPLCCIQGHSVFPLTIVCFQGCDCLLFGCFAVLSFSHRAAGEDSLFLGTLRQIYHVGGGSHLQSYILSEFIWHMILSWYNV